MDQPLDWRALYASRISSSGLGRYINPPSQQRTLADDFAQDEEGNYKLPQSEVATIKQELVGLMISVPPNIQSQLGDAVGIIADSDFWERWDTLVDVWEQLDSAIRTLR